MPLHELTARTARIPSRVPATPPTAPSSLPLVSTTGMQTERTSLKGLDLATLAAPNAPATTNPNATPPIDDARLLGVPAAVNAVKGPAQFAAVRAAIDGIGDLEARQRAFLRVLETFGSEWTPDSTSRVMWNGGVAAVGELRKRNLWQPWTAPRGQAALKLTPEQQTQFIETVVAPSWQKLVDDTAAYASSLPASSSTSPFDAALAQHARGLIELEKLWGVFAKPLWPAHTKAVSLDDAALATLVGDARPADRIAVAGAVHAHRPEAAAKLVDGAIGAASFDDVGAVLLAADQPGSPLAPVRALVGAKLAATHSLDGWRAYAAEPRGDDVDSVKDVMKRAHAAALAIEAGKLGDAATIKSVWLERVARFDLDDVASAAKVVALAESLTTSRYYGPSIVDDTLALMPDTTLVKLAQLPPSTPPKPAAGKPATSMRAGFGAIRSSGGAKYVEDPQTRIHREAANHIRTVRPDVLSRMLDAPSTSSSDARERLGLTLAFLTSYDAGSIVTPQRDAIAAATARAVSSLLRDPSTTDEPRTPGAQPSDTSVQKLLVGAKAIADVVNAPLPIDVDGLAPWLPTRSSEELGALLAKSWCGDAATNAVHGELRARFDETTLDPHEALLMAAFANAPADPDRASLDAWCTAQRAQGKEKHAATLLAVARAFGPGLDASPRKDAVEGAVLASFSVFVDDVVAESSKPRAPKLDDKRVRELFGLAHEIEQKMPRDFAPKLSTLTANKLPLDAVSAPFVDDKLGFALRSALPAAHDAAEARIASLTPNEAVRFFDGATDAAALTERIGLALRAWCGVGAYDNARANDARGIAENAIGPALERLARIGDPANADQRKLVLFAPRGVRDKLGADVVVDVNAHAARRFVEGAPAKDVLALCLDSTTTRGLYDAAVADVEARARGGDVGVLHELLDAFGALTSSSSSSKAAPPADIAAWNKLVDEQLDAFADRPWRALWSAVDDALARSLQNGDVAARTRDVLALLPSSREQNQALVRALGAPPIAFEALAEINAYGIARNDDTVLRPERRLLAQSIVAYPDGPFALIHALDRRASSLPPALVDAWHRTSDVERRAVVEDSFQKLFHAAYGDTFGGGRVPDPVIQKRVDDALEKTVFSTLRQDPDLASLVDRLQPIFRGLPRNVQARVAAAFALDEETHDPPAVLRRLLENAGVVAIKVAQQICEDPKIPKRFRDVLESLRDQNLEVDALDAWSVVGGNRTTPAAAEKRGYDAFGKRLGTGSVKQANRVVSTQSSSSEQPPLVLAFLKPGVKDEIEQSLRALAVDKELAPIVDRVRSMLTRELDLDLESAAFSTMKEHLSFWNFMRVPDVIAHARESLLRTMSPGVPVSEILRTRTLDDDEKHVLQESYRALFSAALDPARFLDRYDYTTGKNEKRGFVLTDPHQGNVALDRTKDGRVVVDLFDPGQFEMVDAHEASLFVQLVVHLSQSFWGPSRDSLVSEFAHLIYDNAQKSPSPYLRSSAPSVEAVAEKLRHAWDEAARTQPAGKSEPGAFLRAWLFAAADEGLQIPDAYFGVAKMLHTIDSQCRELGLDDVISDEVARLYRGQLTFKKALGLFGKKLGGG